MKNYVLYAHVKGLVTVASTEYLLFATFHTFLMFSKTWGNTLVPG